jgi:methionyl-tRNA formyltransferase
MKILLWIGSATNHKALANKLSNSFDIEAIVIEKRPCKARRSFIFLFKKIFERLLFNPISLSWHKMMRYFDSLYPNYPISNLLFVENINERKVFNFSNKIKPDLIVVSGTSIVRKELLRVKSKFGIINLHTGLSPYVKGGPNCTNWCISNGDFHLVGNTVMWIDEGIDSGNIILTEQTNVNWRSSLFNIHLDVMNHAHSLYEKAIFEILNNTAKNVEQNKICEGSLFYNKQWNLKTKMLLIFNLLRIRYNRQLQQRVSSRKKEVITVSNNFLA